MMLTFRGDDTESNRHDHYHRYHFAVKGDNFTMLITPSTAEMKANADTVLAHIRQKAVLTYKDHQNVIPVKNNT